MNKVFLEKKFIGTEFIEEVEELLRSEFGLDCYDEEGDYLSIDFMGDVKNIWYDPGYPVSIKELSRVISELEEKGATHVSVSYGGDSESYSVHGYQIRNIDQDVARKEFFESEVKRLKGERIQLQSKLKVLDKYIENMSHENG